MPNCSVDWTATWTMFQALFTLLLVGLAFWAGCQAKKSATAAWASVEKERVRLNEDRERALAAQASRVYATRVNAGGNAANLSEPSVKVTNGSDLPIYDVAVVTTPEYYGDNLEWLSKYGSIREELKVPEIMPHQSKELDVTHGVLTFKWGWEDVPDSLGISHYKVPNHVHMSGFTAYLHFRDASGLIWQRDPKGILSRSPDLTGADNTGP